MYPIGSLTWDIGIGGVAAILTAYSILIRKHRSLATLVSAYVAYFVATGWSQRIADFFNGDRVLFNNVWIKANATNFSVSVTLLVLFTVLLSSFIKLGGKRSKYSALEVGAYSVCTTALLLLFILLLMPDALRATVLTTSKIAPYVYEWREYVLVAPVFVMIYFGIYRNDD